MTEKIKEMNLSEMLFNRDEKLLDYITNLQQENERLNNIIYREISNYILKKYGMLDDTHYHDFLNELIDRKYFDRK